MRLRRPVTDRISLGSVSKKKGLIIGCFKNERKKYKKRINKNRNKNKNSNSYKNYNKSCS